MSCQEAVAVSGQEAVAAVSRVKAVTAALTSAAAVPSGDAVALDDGDVGGEQDVQQGPPAVVVHHAAPLMYRIVYQWGIKLPTWVTYVLIRLVLLCTRCIRYDTYLIVRYAR